jgi:hypothetical protein
LAAAKTKPTAADPWCPIQLRPECKKSDANLIQQLFSGTLDKGEAQLRAVRFIVETLCGTYDLSYRPGEDGRRDSDFAEGKRFIGSELVKLSKLNLTILKE